MSRAIVTCGLVLGALVSGCSSHATAVPASSEAPASGGEGAGSVSVSVPGFAVLPVRSGAVPVLVFHEICAAACGPADLYGVSPAEFERMMLGIKSAGYETISIRDFVRAHDGDTSGLPPRPILVTFDDGRQDGYHGADDVLRRLGQRATMFVITGVIGQKPAFFMQWNDVEAAAGSGRWDIQLHAHAGHVQVPVAVDASGTVVSGAFYGWRRCVLGQCSALETFEDWRERTETDIETGDAILASTLGYTSVAFAVPYSDYGQHHSNDPAIAPALRAYLDARFAVWFTQPGADPEFMTPSTLTHEVPRYLIRNTTTADDIYVWLAKHASPRTVVR